MNNKFFHLNKTPFQVEGLDLVDFLYPRQHWPRAEHWYSTPCGGVRLVRKRQDGALSIKTTETFKSIYLADADAVVDYLTRSLAFDYQTEPMDLFALALYPGYFTINDSAEYKTRALDVLLQARGLEFLIAGLTNLLKRSDRIFGQFTEHVLHYMPPTYVAKIGAHTDGNSNPFRSSVANSRFAESLSAGWEYQLANPNEQYSSLVASIDRRPNKSIPRFPSNKEILASSGLKKADLISAGNIAAAFVNDGTPEYRSMVLNDLATRRAMKAGIVGASNSQSLLDGIVL